MRLGVIGEPCIDFIHRPKSTGKKLLGGVLYSVTSLAAISNANDEVYPIMNLGSDEFSNITSFLSSFKNIKHDFIYNVNHKTRVVNLYYNIYSLESTSTDREECSTEPALPLDFNSIKPALEKIDALLINMVSGVDISLETLDLIRNSFKGYIHIDLHNVVMKTDTDGRRTRGKVENWKQWCTRSDTIQMNEAEINAMTNKKLSEYEVSEKILSESKNTDNGKPGALVITRGKGGVSMYQKKETQAYNTGEKYFEIERKDLPSVETNNFKDSTGCGDVFASCFFYKNSASNKNSYIKNLRFANRIAGIKSTLMGVEELHKLKV